MKYNEVVGKDKKGAVVCRYSIKCDIMAMLLQDKLLEKGLNADIIKKDDIMEYNDRVEVMKILEGG